ncbi:MAG: hypothetical protein JWN84_753 [Nocardioides sp.]|jgi:hypothetical protein|nr:hypothetical protein [Nocardioides sp.]
MRRPLGPVPTALLVPLLAVPLLAGCGDDSAPTASDPAGGGSSSSSPAAPAETATDLPTTTDPTKSAPITPGGVPFELREMVSGTAGQGELSPDAVPLASDADVEAFVAGFSEQLAEDVRVAVAAEPARTGEEIYGAVVGLGCDVPPGVSVRRDADGYAVTGAKVADPLTECFAAVTSVAIVAIQD